MPPRVSALQHLLRNPVALAVARRRLPTYGVALTAGVALTWYLYEPQLSEYLLSSLALHRRTDDLLIVGVPERLTVYADSEQPSRILDATNVKDAFVGRLQHFNRPATWLTISHYLLVDSATSINFPQILRPLALSNTALTLVGLGVRTVSFLRVKVYSAGFYLEESALAALSGQLEWKVSPIPDTHCISNNFSRFTFHQSFTADRLTKSNGAGEGELVGEALMHKLLSQPINCAIRIGSSGFSSF